MSFFGRKPWLVSTALVVATFACGVSQSEHPGPAQSGSETGVVHHVDAAGDDDAEAGEAGAEGSTPASTVSPVGCETLDPKQVYLVGSLEAFGGTPASVTLTSPPTVCLAPVSSYFVIRPSDGRVLEAPTDMKLHLFARDVLAFDAQQKVWGVAKPLDNDDVLPITSEAFNPLVWPDTSDYAWGGATTSVHTKDGKVIATGSRPRLGYTGHIFDERVIIDSNADAGITAIQDAELNGALQSSVDNLIAIRALPDGFRLAAKTGTGPELTQWTLHFDGTATKTGTYAEPPADFNKVFLLPGLSGGGRLDDAGNLYVFANPTTKDSPNNNNAVVLKRPLTPGVAAVVYDSGASSSDLTVSPPKIWVRINVSTLVTGP